MISENYRLSKDEFIERERLKAFYKSSPIGIQELCREIYDGKLLSQISGDDDIYKHNLAVRRLERMGLLDQESLEDLVRWMLDREPRKYPADIEENVNAYEIDGRTHSDGT